MIAKEIESYKEHGFIWPPLTTADINHNRLLLGEAPWSDIDLRPKERRRP